ncbi:GrpB protein-domain-containing protein [Dendryphion nanum]|uniref:GrpB protein-domain-containing protein n=1 Tax=Dendryphion nanum TaxID=256645 RepID=A0A9P9IT33_9PLEO|nr:GrpB protein-domain-containing protein [Dendryphion nanum]
MSVAVEQYNPEWPNQFQEIKTLLESFLSSVEILSIQHVGSTSVPGLAAKPILDIDIIVTRANVQLAIDALVTNGKCTYLGERGILDRHALSDPNQFPPRNIYVCVAGAFQTRNHLAVRDTLRADPNLRDQYAKIKLDLAAQGTNIEDYVKGKTAILQEILKQAGVLSEDELSAIRAANNNPEIHGAIKTERLMLREYVMADEEAYYGLVSLPELARYQSWHPFTKTQAHEYVARILRDSSAKPRLYIELAVLRNEHEFIGTVGAMIKRLTPTGEPMNPPHADLWFTFMPHVQRKGYATEAMEAFLPLLEGPVELEIECDPRNVASWKLAERLGFERTSLVEEAYECKGEMVGSMVYRKQVGG